MTGKQLIIELLKLDTSDLDKEIQIYSIVDMEKIDIDISQFELVANNIEVGSSADGDSVLIEGYY